MAKRARSWTLCAGSGQKPTAFEQYGASRSAMLGACPVCGRLMRVSPRTDKLYQHASTPPKTYEEQRAAKKG